jgi:hypothetical protein
VSKQTPIELSLEDEDELLSRGKPRLPAGAYNPYDVDPRATKAKAAAATKAAHTTDLRKLSQWIKLKRDVDELKTAGPEPEAPLQSFKKRITKVAKK